MNENLEPQGPSNASPSGKEMMDLMKKMQQHLVYLEKKIDLLIREASHKPFNGKRFPKPDRSAGGHPHPQHRMRTGASHASGGRNRERSGAFGSFQGGQGHSYSRREKRPFRGKR